ncbi:hypothetical protein [Glutamicibacter nicotianae]|uniref:hypothetical protein n=1 Tax=Glutamicibacter nicotianae TaxID=37929 RepID=UPI00307A2390
MPLALVQDDELEDHVTPELAAEIRESIHGGDCRVCNRPLKASQSVRLDVSIIESMRFTVWARHATCQPSTQGMMGNIVTPHDYRWSMFGTVVGKQEARKKWFRKTAEIVKVPVPAIILNPSINGPAVDFEDVQNGSTSLMEPFAKAGYDLFTNLALLDPSQRPDTGMVLKESGQGFKVHSMTKPYGFYDFDDCYPEIRDFIKDNGGVFIFVTYRHFVDDILALGPENQMRLLQIDDGSVLTAWVPLSTESN